MGKPLPVLGTVAPFTLTIQAGEAVTLDALRGRVWVADIIFTTLFDPLEMELPELGLVTVEDAETGEQLFIDTADPAFRQRYAAEAAARETSLRQALAHAGADTLELSTDDDLLEALLRFAALRRQRGRLKVGGRFPTHLRSDTPQQVEGAVT